MEFITSNLPLLLCGIIGFILLLVEALMPGFGIAGISGIILEVVAIYLAWANHGIVFGLCVTLALLIVTGLAIYLSYRSVLKGRLSKSSLVLKEQEAPLEDVSSDLKSRIGRSGTAATPLRPGGTVEMDGVRFPASSEGDFIPKDTRVEVTGVEGSRLIVRPQQA